MSVRALPFPLDSPLLRQYAADATTLDGWSSIRKLRTYRRLATCQADLERAPLSMTGSLFLSSNVHPGCGRRGPHANLSRRRRAGILPVPARVQRRMELSRFALRILTHTTLSRSWRTGMT